MKLGVTIGCGSVFYRMANLAAKRFSQMSGWDAVVLGDSELESAGLPQSHFLKLRLFELLPEASEIVFFDADLILLRQFAPETLRSNCGFSAVKDCADAPWIIGDAKRAGVSPEKYFNSGFFWASRAVRQMFQLAEQLRTSGEVSNGNDKLFDQTFLNAAAARSCECHFLPWQWNVHEDPSWLVSLDNIYGLHLHGLASDPDRMERYFEEPETLFWRR